MIYLCQSSITVPGGVVFYLAVYQFNSLDKSGDFEKWEEELSGVGQTRGVSMVNCSFLHSFSLVHPSHCSVI